MIKVIKKQVGFTLLELIVVIIMIGILATNIIPKMFDSNGFEEIGYQAETVSKLRAIQLRAMQDTSGTQCLLVYITEKKLGIPDDNCTPPSFISNNDQSNTVVKITEQHLSFDDKSGGYSFSFDQMGRPDQSRIISIVGGEQTLSITIEAEGYIHAN